MLNPDLFLPPAAIRELDRRAIEDYSVPGIVLMENAGANCARWIATQPEPFLICCGKGNNGGDGFVIARHLDRYEFSVELLLFGDPSELRGDALTNFEIVRRMNLPLTICSDQQCPEPSWLAAVTSKLAQAGTVIDALLGTGTAGEPRFPLDLVIHAINAAHKTTIAIDLPSGLDAAAGIPAAATVRATHTLTFVAQKTGFASAAARECLGQIYVLDIGAPRVLVETIVRENPPKPNT